MNYKDIYYKQYQKKADELHQLILDEFKKAKDRMKNFEFVKKVILKKLADIEHKSLDDSEENIKLLLDTYFLKTEYQRGSEDLIFENELKEKYDELKENLNFSTYNSFLKALANYDVTVEIKSNFGSYWGNLRSMYRLNKYEGYDSFKKFDLIQLRKDGNQAISKELHEIESKSIDVSRKKKEINPIKQKEPEKVEILSYEKFRIADKDIEFFESDNCYKFIVQQIFDQKTLSKIDFQNLFIRGKTTEKPIKIKCSTQLFAKFLHALVHNYYDKLVFNYLIKNQKIITSNDNPLKSSNLSNSKTNSSFSKDEMIYNKIIDDFKNIAKENKSVK